MLRVLGCLRALLGSQGILDTSWTPGIPNKQQELLLVPKNNTLAQGNFLPVLSSVKLEYSLIWLTTSKEERNRHHPWISLCFSTSIIYQIIKMKYFVYFKIFFPVFPSPRDPIRDSHLRSQSRMYVLQYVMNLSWRESPAFHHL